MGLFLALAVIISVCLTGEFNFFTAAAEDSEIWDGTIAEDYAAGDGSKGNPYQIATAEQLALLANSSHSETAGKYYELTQNIRLNDTSAADWQSSAKQWFPDLDYSQSAYCFSGTLEGNGHTITGLYVDYEGEWVGGGLFKNLQGDAVVRNLGFAHAYVSYQGSREGWAGVLSAYAKAVDQEDAVRIIGCWAEETVSVNASSGAGFIGGGNAAMQIDNCYFLGEVACGNEAAGNAFWGGNWGSTSFSLTNCYAVGSYLYRDDNQQEPDEARDLYSSQKRPGDKVTQLTEQQMTGEAARIYMSGLDWETVWKTTENGYPTLNVIPADYVEPVEPDDSFDGVAGEPWSGKTATRYAGGTGTAADPFLIATPEQLAKLVQESAADTKGKYYKLTEDIRLNDTTGENWKENNPKQWFINSNYGTATFQGTLEGDGHTISGFFIRQSLAKGQWVAAGLFGSLGDGATIRNIYFTESEVTLEGNGDSAFVGLISGYANQPAGTTVRVNIIGCSGDSSVSLKAVRNGQTTEVGAGGFLGATPANVTFDNCYFTGKVECSDETAANAFCGSNWVAGVSITNSYTVDNQTYRQSPVYIKNVYSNQGQANVTRLTKEEMTGEAAKTNMADLDWETVWKATDGYPALNVIPADYQDPDKGDGAPGDVWTGKVAPDYAGGDGSEGNPYQIATAEQLAKLVETIVLTPDDTKGKYYKLTENIRLNDTSAENWEESAKQWYTVESASTCFQGHFDGNGHVVSGLYINETKDEGNIYAGLFPAIWHSASISNVGLSQSHITARSENGEAYAGGIVAYVQVWWDPIEVDQYPKISGCFGDADVILNSQFTGGILGGAPCPFVIENSYFIGTLNATGDRAGGIIGNSWITGEMWNPGNASVRDCYTATPGENSATGVENSRISFTDTYSTAPSINGIASLGLGSMRGALAEERMTGFDFERVWKALENGTPVLRMYNSDAYTNTDPGRQVKISFVSNGGNELEPIYGEEGDPIVWPTVERYGYAFEGWYVYEELDVRFTLDSFPMYDVTLYANWIKVGIEQGFENYPYNNEDGLGSDYQYIRPGILNYSANDVHGGSKAIRRLGEVLEEQDMVLFGSELGKLTAGQEYDLTFWVYTDKSDARPVFKLGHTDYPDIIEPAKWYESIPLEEDLPAGEWIQVSYTFIADAPYLVFRTSGVNMVLDDFQIVPTGKSGSPSKKPADTSQPAPPPVDDPVDDTPVTGVLSMAGVAATAAILSLSCMVLLRRKKRHTAK